MKHPAPYLIWLARLAGVCAVLTATGCQNAPKPVPTTSPAATGLAPLAWDDHVQAQCDPPTGWTPLPLQNDSRHTEILWVSPSTDTAYGIVHINLPLPVGLIGVDRILQGILDDMVAKQKMATVLGRQDDDKLPGLHVDIKGGEYHVRGDLTAISWEAWFVYASTSNDDPIHQKELDLAESARDHTIVRLRSGQ